MNRTLKIKFLSVHKNLKNTDYKNVFINEDLIKLRFKLFQMVRKCEDVKSASTRDGKIICSLQNGTKAVISSPDDLFKLGFQDVDYQKLGLAELQGGDGGEYSDGGIQLCENVSKKANKVIKNKVVNDSFCKLKVLTLNVCRLVSKLRNPDFREFISENLFLFMVLYV